jgi:putative nucleotidyltransferase with HDIG domain
VTIHPYPIRVRRELIGLLLLAMGRGREWREGEHEQIRQLIDQFAVALTNARLVSNLDQMNWGMLTALARAIDAKSPWTAGHSERVTTLALQIGDVLGLSAESREVLHRGGLLHDLGKIGIPAEILDKPGRLTPEETEVMRSHTLVGARILEPIPAFREVVPIILQHHERWDGEGYPHGLAGEKIDRLARVLTVADYFDALTSERPYRSAHEKAEVIKQIGAEAGRLFDPEAVAAFRIVAEKNEGGSIESLSPAGIHGR